MPEEEKFYLTKEGLSRIKREQAKLQKIRKLKSKQEAPSMLHSEELSTEFISYQEDLDRLEFRLKELEYILKHCQLITLPSPKEQNRVHLGAQVEVEVDGQIDEFLIVGTLETNPDLGKISTESPIGKALLGHRVGEEVVIRFPTKVTYKIVRIKYPSL